MTKIQSDNSPANKKAQSDPQQSLRVRAAWLYYVEGMTQSDVAQTLNVSRIMVTRLLSEARTRGEVTIKVNSRIAPQVKLQRDLEIVFGLKQAIVCNLSDKSIDPTRAIAAAGHCAGPRCWNIADWITFSRWPRTVTLHCCPAAVSTR